MSMTSPDAKALSREEDTAMVKAVLEGDATAYRGLVEKYETRVYSLVYGMIRNREDAKDLTQDAFVKAYKSLKSFRLEASFYTWVYRIAMNVTIDFTRKRKRREVSGFEEDMAILEQEEGKAFRAKRDDFVASADLRDRLASMTLTAVFGCGGVRGSAHGPFSGARQL